MSNKSEAAVQTGPGSSSWTPTHDFIYFRYIGKVEAKSKAGVVIPGSENMHLGHCISVGPGRATPAGTIRHAPVEPGDYFLINGLTKGVVTEFMDDDGRLTYCVEGNLVIARRKDAPPYARDVERTGSPIVDPVTGLPVNDNAPRVGSVKATGLLDPSGKPQGVTAGNMRSIKVEN